MEQTRTNKKTIAIVAAVACLALAAALGTYAWLTSQSSLTNTFTVGSINTPDKQPDGNDPEKPGSDDWKVTGNLIETKWVDKSKLVPGASIDKNPNVGLGKDSDSAYVFVYVKNALVNSGTKQSDTPYFTIGSNWAAVPGTNEAWVAKTTGTDDQYISGLFMYKKGASDNNPVALVAKSDASVFTGELFSAVTAPSTLTKDMVASNPQMIVSAYIFGADQKDGSQSSAETALAQAKAWAAEQAE